MKNMWVKKVIAAAVTITMLTTSASTLSVMADAENTTTETETAVDSTESVSDAEQEVQQVDAQTNESDNETVDSVQKDEQNVAEKDAKLAEDITSEEEKADVIQAEAVKDSQPQQAEVNNDNAQVQPQAASVVADEPKAVSEENKGADITAPVCESISIDKQGQTY